MKNLLTKEDVEELTGRKHIKAQKERLDVLKIPYFDLDVNAYPRLTWSAVNSTLLNTAITEPKNQPNFDAI